MLLQHLFGATANSWHSEWVAAWAQCVSARLLLAPAVCVNFLGGFWQPLTGQGVIDPRVGEGQLCLGLRLTLSTDLVPFTK